MRNGLILKSLHVFRKSTGRLASFFFFFFFREREVGKYTDTNQKKKRQGKTDQAGGLAYCTAMHQQCTLGFSIQGSHECDDATLCIRNEKNQRVWKEHSFLLLFCISRGIPASILCSSSFIGLCHPHRFHTFSSQFVACSACKPRSAPRHLDPIVSPNNFQLSPFLVSLIVSKFDRSQGTSSLQGHQHNNDHIDAQAIQQENGGGGKKGWKI